MSHVTRATLSLSRQNPPKHNQESIMNFLEDDLRTLLTKKRLKTFSTTNKQVDYELEISIAHRNRERMI